MKRTTQQLLRILATLVLTGILSWGGSLTRKEAANASPRLAQFDAGEQVKDRGISQETEQNSSLSQLPSKLADAVRLDISRRSGTTPEKLRITNYSRQTWSNGCLGLAKLGEFCTAALVPGWRIVMSDAGDTTTWVYRTDSRGNNLRLESQSVSEPVL